ncbi:hypothetical protein [Ketogulonicigenium vulgare]|uniref:hypothetical protein n=1 Tax=Ketogulonicigenium vulgare TaxID=92945 RepID=UPI002359C60A|nr:hypothetical protein [Ketogulonicigenium vulgare]
MRFSQIYGNGAVMGFTPEQVQRMSLWEFTCAFAAWKKFNSIKSSAENTASAERLQELGIE